MIFQILINQITTLFVSVNLLTSLSFDSPITSYLYGGSQDDLFISLAGGQKTIAIKPKRKDIDSNLLVITETGKYYFYIKTDELTPHQFIEVTRGEINSAYRVVKKVGTVEVWEGTSSMMVVNHGREVIKVNDSLVASKGYFSKGIPIIINGKRELY